jgi:hypothetical protein
MKREISMDSGIRLVAGLTGVCASGFVLAGLSTPVLAQVDGGSDGRPAIHSYDLLFYPVSGAACQQEAQVIADRLQAAAGVDIYQVKCDEQTGEEGSNIRISYISEKPLTITTTDPDLHKDIPNSMYRSAEECQAGLAEERAAFEQHLGLPVFEAYCHAVPRHKGYPYAARIDAIGMAKDGMRVIDDMEMFFSKVMGDKDALAASLTDRLRERGVAAVKSVVGLEDGISEFFVGSRYYAKQALPLKLQEVTYYHSPAPCEQDASDLQALLDRGRVKPLSVFCSDDSLLGNARLYFVMAKGDYLFETAPDAFSGREACLAGKGNIENIYRTRLGRDVIGSLCVAESREDNTWALKVYSNP